MSGAVFWISVGFVCLGWAGLDYFMQRAVFAHDMAHAVSSFIAGTALIIYDVIKHIAKAK